MHIYIIYIYMQVCMYRFISKFIHIYIYTHTHIYIYTYVYLTHGQSFFSIQLHLSVFPATAVYNYLPLPPPRLSPLLCFPLPFCFPFGCCLSSLPTFVVCLHSHVQPRWVAFAARLFMAWGLRRDSLGLPM